MGQFKPMVKMMTTEPSVELKLKKGGKVEKKMQMGGMPAAMPAMPARGGMMPADSPMAPSMAARRRAMMAMPAGAAPAGPIGMASKVMKEGGESTKKGDEKKMARGGIFSHRTRSMGAYDPSSKAHPREKVGQVVSSRPFIPYASKGIVSRYQRGRFAEGGEAQATHAAEMSKMKGLEKDLKSHASKPASKAHKGLKTGGVVDGQGGYKAGGIINTEGQGGKYRNTKMDTTKPDHSPAKTGGVKMGNGGGYATGGVAKSNGGGYRKGGAAKKGYAAGGVVDSGAPVAMPQGRKKPSTPVSINQLSGTFKKGGSVTAAEGRLQKNFKSENATAMKQAKAYSNEVYSKYGKKMNEGGKVDLSKGAYDAAIGPSKEEMEMAKAIRALPRKLFQSAKSMLGMTDEKAPGSVTKTEKSVTVEPSKKRGGLATC
jgi:hypothetical protein